MNEVMTKTCAPRPKVLVVNAEKNLIVQCCWRQKRRAKVISITVLFVKRLWLLARVVQVSILSFIMWIRDVPTSYVHVS
jgi:hypothetical protein